MITHSARLAQTASVVATLRSARGFRAREWVPWVMPLIDIVALCLCLAGGYAVRRLLDPWFPLFWSVDLYRGLFYAIFLFPIAYFGAWVYPGYGYRGVERVRARVLVTALVFGALIAWDYLILKGQWSRGILLVTFGLSVVVMPVVDALVRELFVAWRCWGMPVVVVGEPSRISTVLAALKAHPHLGYIPVAVIDPDGKQPLNEIDGLPVLRGESVTTELARQIPVCVVATNGIGRETMHGLQSRLPFYRVMLVPDLGDVGSLWVDSRDLGGVLGLEIRNNLLRRRNRWMKTAMNYGLGLPIALVAAPVILFCALLVKLASRGPAFYAQEREGLGGRLIKVWKLRTMHVNSKELLDAHLAADPAAKAEWAQFFKLRCDPRIIPWVGAFFRKSSLDELPQVWNVLRGEMSLVGPRPFPLYHLREFAPEFRTLRCSVLPGMTGLWQVSSRSEGDLAVQERMDTYYIRNWSPWLDVYLLARTLWVVLFRSSGAY